MKKKPKESKVRLSIRTSSKNGFKRAKGADGSNIDYWYKFSDGNNGNGNSKAIAKNDFLIVKVTFKGNGANKYKFDDCYWKSAYPAPSDMFITEIDDADIAIWDTAQVKGTAYYTVVAIHKDSGDIIHCDPRISNDWPSIKRFSKIKKKTAKKKSVKSKKAKKVSKKKVAKNTGKKKTAKKTAKKKK